IGQAFEREAAGNLSSRARAQSGPVNRRRPDTTAAWLEDYFRLAEVKGTFEDLDGWIRRKLRGVIWRQWGRTITRVKGLMQRGLDKIRAWESAMNGRGPWWNAGASHMHTAFPKSYFDRLGLWSLLDQRL